MALLLSPLTGQAGGVAADLARSLREAGLDPAECYRVRDLNLNKEGARFYFTDGYLIFGKPVGTNRTSAVFTTDVEGGDAELLLLPPNRSERRSLAIYTGSPNMDEHFQAAVLLFAGNTYSELMEQIHGNPAARKSPEMGVLLDQTWSSVVRNITSSFETRLVLDLLSSAPVNKREFFVATLTGKNAGNFDVIYDPRAPEQLIAGQVVSRQDRTIFDVWTSFEARSFRERGGKPPEPEFKLQNYRIEATLQPDLKLNVVTRVKVIPNYAERVAPFDLTPQMIVTSALVDGRPAEVLERESMRSNLVRNSGNDLLLVVPPAPLAAGREYEFEFRHEGNVVLNAGNHVYYVSSRGSWYPNRALQFATYDMTFRYPKELDLVTAGEVIEDTTEGEWRITRRATAQPVRLAGFNLGMYQRIRVARGLYKVEVCANRGIERALQPKPHDPVILPPSTTFPRRAPRQETLTLPIEPPPNPKARLQELGVEIASAMEFMGAHFGPAPLPNLVVSPIPGTFGQGFPGLIYLSTLSYLRPQDPAIAHMREQQQSFFIDILQAHEAAHQWWGNVVTSAGYHDDWLMEALANYSALLYLEKRRGARSLDLMLDQYKKDLLAKNENNQTAESVGPVVLGGRLESSQDAKAWRTIIYGKGSWILHMLRRRMGDERFLGMLGELRHRYEYRPVSTEQFRLLAAEFLPPKPPDPELETFFDQWVYGTGIPSLKLSYSVKGKAPALRIVGTVTQSDVDTEFSGQAPIEIQFGHGKAITHWVRTGSEPAVFSVTVRQPPTKVALDPHFAVLRK